MEGFFNISMQLPLLYGVLLSYYEPNLLVKLIQNTVKTLEFGFKLAMLKKPNLGHLTEMFRFVCTNNSSTLRLKFDFISVFHWFEYKYIDMF